MKKKPPTIELSKSETSRAIDRIKDYIQDAFDMDIGNLQASIFIDYLTEHIGPYYYNKGVEDSMRFMNEKTEELYLLMKDTEAEDS